MITQLSDKSIAIIGQGYVGLPLALAFGEFFPVVGFDINQDRISELNRGEDVTLQADQSSIQQCAYSEKSNKGVRFSSNWNDISDCAIYIVTVPTPIDQFKAPDLSFIKAATDQISKILKKGDLVIYESTVYPGCTEEECVPILEGSGLIFNQDFFVGYSPERINPGDPSRNIKTIKKVTSGSTDAISIIVDDLYKTIVTAGTHKASSIKVAEASKAIENAQRDINISFVNELALIFDRIGIDTGDVIEAASTKWNFLSYKPGLVGGHCIGVDPYYLAHKAESLGYHPQVILSGRRVNDQMGMFVANKVVKLMIAKGLPIKSSKALVLGITFKENCTDIRNSKVIDVISELQGFGLDVDVFDPWADAVKVNQQYGVDLLNEMRLEAYSAIVLAVSHSQFHSLNFETLDSNKTVVFDTKGILPRHLVDARL